MHATCIQCISIRSYNIRWDCIELTIDRTGVKWRMTGWMECSSSSSALLFAFSSGVSSVRDASNCLSFSLVIFLLNSGCWYRTRHLQQIHHGAVSGWVRCSLGRCSGWSASLWSYQNMKSLNLFWAGVLIGIPVLKNIDRLPWERVLWWVCLVVYLLIMTMGILFNIFYEGYPPTDWRKCCPDSY